MPKLLVAPTDLQTSRVRLRFGKLLLTLACVIVTSAGLLPVAAHAQSRELPDFADLVERTGPAVVNIRTTERARTDRPSAQPGVPEGMDENDPFFEFFRRFMPPRNQQGPGGSPNAPNTPNAPNAPNAPRGRGGEESPRGVGSGFIVSADGYAMTNHHVVDGADEIYVTLTDKREFKAKLIGSDRRTDVALVKIEASNLPKLTLGDPNRLRVGEWVVAIGSPFGLENTVTAGIVSAKGRDTGDFLPFIQTDVAVNPGNSGGPLLNMRGEVVGINSQIYSRTGGFMGISFAIPIDEANRVAEQLKANGRVVRGRIGVGIAEVTKDVAEPLGLAKASGALVRSVEANGPAEKAGIEVGDIIIRFDGKSIEKSSDLPRIVGGTKPGSKTNLQVWRKGATRDLNVVVVELEPEKSAKAPATKPGPGGTTPAPKASNALGLVVADIPDEKKSQLRIKSGVLVEAADGAAARAGIQTGDVILSIDNQDVQSARQFNELVNKTDRGKTSVALVRRGENASFVPIRPLAAR
jgi:serine protease Do